MSYKIEKADNEYLDDLIHTHTLKNDIHRNIVSALGNDYLPPRKDTYYHGLAHCMRNRLIERWILAQRTYYKQMSKRVYYLSMEFLPGPFLMKYIISLDMQKECEEALADSGFTLEDLLEEEWDPGLGNGGLGRLASCYMDSMASLGIPGYGYGIRYDYGIFYQRIVEGYQVEVADKWLRYGNPFELKRENFSYTIHFYGNTERYRDDAGNSRYRWVNTDTVHAIACDILIPGSGNVNVNNMRLWTALSSESVDLEAFNRGNYMQAMESKVLTENISKVLYPSDEAEQGKELRFRQQYFFVSATFQDIMRRFKKRGQPFSTLPDAVAVQLNDTHPAISIPELMRILLDEEQLTWEESWEICQKTFAYTNHTVLPEALEKWPVSIVRRILPRHMEIIFEINSRFLELIRERYPDNQDILSRLSIIEEGPVKQVRMANLAIIGSHSVNGVAELHSNILKKQLFREFNEIYPGKFINITNGITPRRWLRQSNPELAELITNTIGGEWIRDLYELKKLIPHADRVEFQEAWATIKLRNKKKLAAYIEKRIGITVHPETLFDIQVKRIHEYKRQLMNVLHVLTLYNRLKNRMATDIVPRTVIFGGKAAPSYYMAKLIIKLITSVAKKINGDPDVKDALKVVFLPNYCVSVAQKIIPAADLSEQISTAGMEASGTGNMKFALNGALTVGTLDGANIEIGEEVGAENIFIFGLKTYEIDALKGGDYNPREYYSKDPELRNVLDQIGGGYYSPDNTALFRPIIQSLLDYGDRYFVLADYRSYVETQKRVSDLFRNKSAWRKSSILNTANMGKFSSDRAVAEYAEKIWDVKPIDMIF